MRANLPRWVLHQVPFFAQDAGYQGRICDPVTSATVDWTAPTTSESLAGAAAEADATSPDASTAPEAGSTAADADP